MDVTVCFSVAAVRAKRIDQKLLAAAYAAAYEALTGTTVALTRPQHIENSDWSDYDHPIEEHVVRWGREDAGVQVLFSGQYDRGRPAGALGFWSGLGLERGALTGQTKLHRSWQSYAELTVVGPAAELAAKRFREVLREADVLAEPDGAAIQAVEDVLTQLCWFQEPMDQVQIGKLVPVVGATPAGSSAAFLLAALHLAERNAAAAGPLLDGLTGPFGYGIVVGRDLDGIPNLIAWQDRMPDRGQELEILSLQALIAELTGQPALPLYQQVVDAGVALTSPEAAKQVARLT